MVIKDYVDFILDFDMEQMGMKGFVDDFLSVGEWMFEIGSFYLVQEIGGFDSEESELEEVV